MNNLGTWTRRTLGTTCAALLLFAPGGGFLFAQDALPPPSSYPPQGAASAPSAPLLSPNQLSTLVAPVALYPDNLLSQVLVASTYPLEIVEAGQWLQQNRNLQGQQLVDAAQQQNWDPSIQALVVFPDVLSRLNSDIQWTTDLGNAFLAQQADVMNAVQRMRSQAMAAGKLRSNAQETVTTQYQDGQDAVEIQPANPDVVYVPQYNPEYIWGTPAWGYYPPLYYPAYSFGFGPGIYIGGFFGGLGWGGWGWGPNWFHYSIFQNAYFFNHYGFHNFYGGGYRGFGGGYGRGFQNGAWAHNPAHRMGVPYSNQTVASRFGGNFAGRGAGSFANRGNPGGSFGNRANLSAGGRSPSAQPQIGNRFSGSPSNQPARGGWQHNSQPAYRGSSTYADSSANRSTPSFGGVRNMPAYHSAPAFGGNSYRSAPSSGAGFGGVRSAPSSHSTPSFNGSRGSFSHGGGSFRSTGSPSSHSGGGHSGARR